MARVTIEDCLDKVENRFKLVLVAAQRARDIIAGAPKLLPAKNNDKDDVHALREISAGLLDINKINEEIVRRHQKHQQFGQDDDSANADDIDSEVEQEFGNKDSIITNMYESESYGDALPEGDIMVGESIMPDEDEDEDGR